MQGGGSQQDGAQQQLTQCMQVQHKPVSSGQFSVVSNQGSQRQDYLFVPSTGIQPVHSSNGFQAQPPKEMKLKTDSQVRKQVQGFPNSQNDDRIPTINKLNNQSTKFDLSQQSQNNVFGIKAKTNAQTLQ